MSFPIENFRILVPIRAKNVKGMIVSISIYPISPAEASVIVVFNGKSNVKSMLKFDIPVDEELGKETTERTALYTALLSARATWLTKIVSDLITTERLWLAE